MAKGFTTNLKPDPEFAEILERSRKIPITKEMLQWQRLSFAYGNSFEEKDETWEEFIERVRNDPFWAVPSQ